MAVQPVPEGYSTVTPIIVTANAGKLMDFVTTVFGGTERFRMSMPDGGIAHAEMQVGDSIVMFADETPEFASQTAALHLYVENCDEMYQKGIAAGASSVMEPTDHFYGDRSGTILDPWGNRWNISTHVEDVSDEEVAQRMAAYAEQAQG